MKLEYKSLMELCSTLGVAVPANMRVDQQLASRLIGECATAAANRVDTRDATATAADIAMGKTAYVNNVKVTGTKE